MSQTTNILSTLSNHKCHKWIFLIFFLFYGLVLLAQGERKHIRQGNQSFEESDYKKAEISYRKGLEKNASSVPGIFNLGDAFYKQNNFPLQLTRKELAELASMSVESIARILTKFKDDKMIRLDQDMLEILDYEKLTMVSRNG